MPGFFDKIAKAAQQAANAAQEAASDSGVQLEIHALTGKMDEHAEALGYIAYRQHKGETVSDEEVERILAEMDRIDSERKIKQAQLNDHEPVAPSAAPVPAGAPAPAAAPAAPAAPAATTCQCGAAIAPGTKFCGERGARVS